MQEDEFRYLFRGRHIHTREWIVGPSILFFPNGEVYVYPKHGYDSPDSYQIDPETFAQYIGVNDSRGDLIFDTSIIRVSDIFGNYTCTVDMRRVLFDIESNSRQMGTLTSSAWQKIEVIGTKHDNPELLNP